MPMNYQVVLELFVGVAKGLIQQNAAEIKAYVDAHPEVAHVFDLVEDLIQEAEAAAGLSD